MLQAERLRRKADSMAAQLQHTDYSEHWSAFERIVSVLLQAGALMPPDEHGRLHATTLGRVAREMQSQNPLWLAMAMLHPAVQVHPCGPCQGP